MPRAVDVLVVGAGPGGSVAARRCAEAGLRVLLIEKRQEIGAPVRCAEAVGADATRPFIDLDPKWIDARIARFALCNAEGARAELPPSEPTLVVNRKVFDLELARLAARAGAEVRARTQAEGVLTAADGSVCGARIRGLAGPEDVHARIVIAADGTESQVARWAGLQTVPPLADLYAGLQYLVRAVGGWQPDVCEYHIGPSIAPGGYAWVFPKGGDIANVGMVIPADRAADAGMRACLDRFVGKRFPAASILAVVSGGIPVTGGLKRMSTGGLMAVGDAAHQAEPVTGGGINLAMLGGEMAASVAVTAIRHNDVSARALQAYDEVWRARFGRQRAGLLSFRRLLAGLNERECIDIIAALARQPADRMDHGQLLLAVLAQHPRLLLQARALVGIGLHLK